MASDTSGNTHHYYNNIWTQEGQPGRLFWKNVNFNSESYKKQEKVFRAFISGLKSGDRIKSILELGAGTGRITKIAMEELLDPIERYDVVDMDIGSHLEKAKTYLGPKFYDKVSNWMNLDVTSSRFDKTFFGYDPHRKYDLILASELYMYILPKDIGDLISKVSKLGEHHFVSLDWWPPFQVDVQKDWYFRHDYPCLYEKNGLVKQVVLKLPGINQALFHYTKYDMIR
jgi:hypothetical protein